MRRQKKVNKTFNPKPYLEKARELIQKGWVQKDFARDEEGNGVEDYEKNEKCTCFCLLGAIDRAVYPEMNFSIPVETLVVGMLKEKYAYNRNGVIPWNDAPGRTQQEVIDILTDTIKACPKQIEIDEDDCF
jgi:hypothetical protein